MASVATTLRRFIAGATRAFHGARAAFATIVARWRSAIATLGQKVSSLAKKFSSLRTTKRIGAAGEDLVMLGKVEGKEFTRMLRTGRSVEAFEAAAETVLSPAARSSFRHLDDIAALHFPDLSIAKRGEYLTRWRDVMVASKIIKQAERITDAVVLERLIRADAMTLKRTNSLLGKLARHKKLAFLGGSVAIGAGIGIPMLCRTLAEYALTHSGCFMYTRDLTNGVRKCRIVGCSCPMPLGFAAPETRSKSAVASACDEADLWEKMRTRNSDCARGSAVGRIEPFCVHCNWDETDPSNVDYVDKDKLQDNAYVRCETIDALDALNETIGSMVDDAYGAGNKLVNIAKESLASSVNVLPWLLGAVAIFLVFLAIVFVWRFSSELVGDGKGHTQTTVLLEDDRDDRSHYEQQQHHHHHHPHHHHHRYHDDDVAVSDNERAKEKLRRIDT